MKAEDRIALDRLPEDWKYYTLTFPVARYKQLSLDEQIIDEMDTCNREFYSVPRIARRVGGDLLGRRQPLRSLVSNLAYRTNTRATGRAHCDFKRGRGEAIGHGPSPAWRTSEDRV